MSTTHAPEERIFVQPVPTIRIRPLNQRPLDPAGDYVLYWMCAQRRTGWNFGLQRAAWLAGELQRPLVILEALRLDYPHASERLHCFILQGMAANAAALAGRGALYYPYVEPARGAGKGLLAALAQRACAVVADDYPTFFIPAMLAAAAAQCAARLEAVDSCGLLPLAASDHAFPTAHAFRRFLQKNLPEHLAQPPVADPLADLPAPPPILPRWIVERWPPARPADLARPQALIAGLAIDHAVGPVVGRVGGAAAAGATLARFLGQSLALYDQLRNQPAEDVGSGLSPYLHFGHIAAHQVFAALAEVEGWSPQRLGGPAKGARQGWWGLSPAAEAFADQFITWRELGYNFCHHRPGQEGKLASLPDWAGQTLAAHAADPRPYVHDLERLETARTHGAIWNAAQNQLRQEGRIHNYLRMLWGKKILHWTETPAQALAIMVHLNDRWALDGRDPNSHGGIMWCLGRYDRPWGPERPVFGKVRYMSMANTARKLRLGPYLARWSPAAP